MCMRSHAQTSQQYRLTFASVNSLFPCMFKVGVTFLPTLAVPGTPRGATSRFFGFLGSRALGTNAGAGAGIR